MENTDREAESAALSPRRALHPGWVLLAALTPPALAAALCSVQFTVDWPQFAVEGNDGALAAGLTMTVLASLGYLAAAIAVGIDYGQGGASAMLTATALIFPMTLGGALIAVHETQHILTGVGTGLIASGAFTALIGLTVAVGELEAKPRLKCQRMTLRAQAMMIASCAVACSGIVILCRSTLGL